MRYWLVKSEPETYSWDDLVREGRGIWDGVRNFQARNNLRAMKNGDLCLFYHSVSQKAVVGICKVVREHYPDPTTAVGAGDWSVVEVEPVEAFSCPVKLADIKDHPRLQEMALLRQSRLSVCPVTQEQFEVLREMGTSAG